MMNRRSSKVAVRRSILYFTPYHVIDIHGWPANAETRGVIGQERTTKVEKSFRTFRALIEELFP